MKYLTIIRHAKSSWEEPGVDDIERRLNERGREAIGIIGKYLKKKRIHPDLVISSPAVRAQKTAEGISSILSYPSSQIQIKRDIYFGDVPLILELLKHTKEKYVDVFVFGHEPLLSSIIFQLSGRELEKFPTCSVFRMSFDIHNWGEIRPKSGKCEFFVNPKLLGEK